MALTASEGNWRHGVYPAYKSNRKDIIRPVCLKAIREHMQAHHPCFVRPSLEADDILGILATSSRIITHPGEKIIISVDKDMKSIPGLFYDTGARELYEIPKDEADKWHMTQTLTGDTADGYPGCPGIGKIKAGRILDGGNSVAEWWPLVVKAYEKVGLTEADALVQARIARICRVTDYDFRKKEVKLWNP